MQRNHLSIVKAFAGSGTQLGYGRERRKNTVHATPSAHEPTTTAVFISAGEQAPVETLKLGQRRLVLLLLLWRRVNCSLLIAGGVRHRCWAAGIVALVRLVMRIA